MKKLPFLALIVGAVAWAMMSRAKKQEQDYEPGDEYPYEFSMPAGASDTSPSGG